MATSKAERTAVDALRAYLLRALPAKVDTINAARAAILKAPRAGPYVVPAAGSLPIGASRAAAQGAATALTAGTRTATQVATELTAAAIAGLTFSVDAQDRLVITATQAPTGSTRSAVCLGSDGTGTAQALGFDPGGQEVIRAALVAPLGRAVSDGEPGAGQPIDFGLGFWVVLKDRRAEPRSPNIRDDIQKVTLRAEIIAAEPDGAVERAPEFIDSCVEAVRSVLLEDRTLDSAVFLTHLPNAITSAKTFRFRNEQGFSPLMSVADLTLRVDVFERA